MSRLDESDAELMRRIANGDRKAMQPLVRRFASPLLTFLCRMVGDHHLAEELFQEVFLSVWIKGWQYQHPKPLKPWLFKIALNKCRAAWRRGQVGSRAVPQSGGSGFEMTWASSAPGPMESAVATETGALVEAAVLRLPARKRAVVAMRIWEDMSYKEIAEAIDCAEATVRSNMHHALKALRRDLGPDL